MYFRNAAAAIIVYDVTDRRTLNKAEEWAQLIRKNSDPEITISLVGNKVDLLDHIEVTLSQGKRKALELGIDTFAEISAKENRGIDEFMEELGAKVYLVQSTTAKKES